MAFLKIKKKELIKQFERAGYTGKILEAFKKIKRENFVTEENREYAYEDVPLSIGFGATISQPSTVIFMLKHLDVKPGQKVLEIGTGSGYNAALLSELVGAKGHVYSVEIVPELCEFSKKNLKKIKNVSVFLSDGSIGLKKYAKYSRIIVTAACPSIPKELIDQLRVGGILIAPIGKYSQDMIKVKKTKEGVEKEFLGSFVFVPLKGKRGF